jgi:hypothetical protein
VIREPLAVDPDGSPMLDGDVADLAASVEAPPVRSGLHVAVFGALAFALSWVAWLPLVVQHEGWARIGASPYLHLVGSLGPAAAAFVVTSVVDGRAGLRLLLGRMWRGPPRLFAVAPWAGRRLCTCLPLPLPSRLSLESTSTWASPGRAPRW